MKVVLIRIDKIGDLIATLPVDQLSWINQKSFQIKWVISKGLGWIPRCADPVREYFEIDSNNPKIAAQQLEQYLKSEKPDAVVVFYAPWWVSLACWKANVPLRVTRRSQWHSYLFFNRGLRQSRSKAEKHEADYNRELVEYAFEQKINIKPEATPVLKLAPTTHRHLFEKFALKSGEYFIVHPGMAGSALNWPQSHYSTLIEKLINAGTVVITGTKGDEPFLNELRPEWEKHPQVRWLQSQVNMDELLSLLKSARAVIAPSTGVLHLAAAIGTKCVGIYSPVTAHSAVRWGPRGPQAHFIAPLSNEPDCMSTIKVNDVLKALHL